MSVAYDWRPPQFYGKFANDRLNQAPPVANTWYDIISPLTAGYHLPSMIKNFAFYQSNTETNTKNIELQVIIDGITYTGAAANCVNGTVYYVYFSSILALNNATAILNVDTNAQNILYSGEGDARAIYNLRARIRQTTAVGTAQTLVAQCFTQRV